MTNEEKVNMHKAICERLTTTYKKKNSDYGNSFTKTRKIVPNAILIRLYDKLHRLNSLLISGNKEVDDESIEDTLADMANYCIMELIEREIDKLEND